MSSPNLKRQAEEGLEGAEQQSKRSLTEHSYTAIPGPSNNYSIDDNWDAANKSESELEEGEEYEEDEIDSDSNENDDMMVPETVNIEDDSYLSFSDNEITEERISAQQQQNPLSANTTNVSPQKKLKKKRKKKNPNMRKNIRNVLTDTQLDSATQKLRERELDRLMRLGMIANKSVVAPPMVNRSPVIVKPTTKPKQATKPSDVICLSSSDEDSNEPEGGGRPSTTTTLATTTKPDQKEVFVLSSDSDDEELEDDGALANHHSDLGTENSTTPTCLFKYEIFILLLNWFSFPTSAKKTSLKGGLRTPILSANS